jgi:hypothetical protein
MPYKTISCVIHCLIAIGNNVEDMNCYLVGKERCQVAVALITSINRYDGLDHGALYSWVRIISIVKPILIHMEITTANSPPNLTGSLLLLQSKQGAEAFGRIRSELYELKLVHPR